MMFGAGIVIAVLAALGVGVCGLGLVTLALVEFANNREQ